MNRASIVPLIVLGALFGVAALVSRGMRAMPELRSEVVGAVRFDGQPFQLAPGSSQCTIAFQPMGGGPIASAVVQADGTYRLYTGGSTKVAEGGYLVSLYATETDHASRTTEGYPTSRPLLPAMYSNPIESGLTCWVRQGVNHYDIELRSDAGPKLGPERNTEQDEKPTTASVKSETSDAR